MARRASGGDTVFWQCKIDEQARSGLPASEFCRIQWLSLAAFYNWRRTLSVVAAGGRADRTAASAFIEFTIGGAS